ncbi:unnamed protein product [marine sediment metagenome]|uniref:LIM zinc-binding domain-containing protein n=1 Tax=marine sediment metagenome TaxID=412755 RepID=X0SPZ3_9ZZZZ
MKCAICKRHLSLEECINTAKQISSDGESRFICRECCKSPKTLTEKIYDKLCDIEKLLKSKIKEAK